MKDLILLNAKATPALRWKPPASFAFLGGQPLLPVQVSEIGRLASVLPLALCKNASQPSGWAVMAVCGRSAGDNAMVSADGKWLAAAVPDSIRYLPFAMRNLGGGKALAAIDPKYAGEVLASGTDGVSLYGDDGQLHAIARKRVEYLNAHQPKVARTQQVLAALDKAGLIQPWPEAALKAGGITLKGLHTIDEKALSQLPDEVFLSLRKGGALAVAYSCLLSLYQARVLGGSAPAGAPKAEGRAMTSIEADGNLDLEFLNDSETIKFGPLN